MWVRLWAASGCASGHSSEEEDFVWVRDDAASDETLGDYAEEFKESTWIRDSERQRWGFERLTALPEYARESLVKRYESQVRGAQRMLALIRGEPVPEPEGPKTRFERVDDFQNPARDVEKA